MKCKYFFMFSARTMFLQKSINYFLDFSFLLLLRLFYKQSNQCLNFARVNNVSYRYDHQRHISLSSLFDLFYTASTYSFKRGTLWKALSAAVWNMHPGIMDANRQAKSKFFFWVVKLFCLKFNEVRQHKDATLNAILINDGKSKNQAQFLL